MSKDIDLEYCGKGLKGIFSHKKNLFNFDFFKMFLEILKFYNYEFDEKNFLICRFYNFLCSFYFFYSS